jgi:hypothetical protein
MIAIWQASIWRSERHHRCRREIKSARWNSPRISQRALF